MDAGKVYPKILNRLRLSEGISCKLQYDCVQALCEARFSESKVYQVFKYGPARVELAENGELCRILFYLRGIEWEAF